MNLTNWNKIDLNRPSEACLNFLEGYSFNDLLLQINCNLSEINRETVLNEVENELECRMNEARHILRINLNEIVRKAQENRQN